MRALVFSPSTSRGIAAAGTSSLLIVFACVLAFAAVPAFGVTKVDLRVPEPSDGLEQDAPAKAPEVRATQINRCPDGSGGLRLQDRPCAPVETHVATAAAATASAALPADVIDLSALPSRTTAKGVPTSDSVARSEKPGMLRSLRDGALRLVAFVVAVYVLWRLGRWLRAWLGQRLPKKPALPADSRSYGRPAPRPRAVIRRPERRRGSRSRRSS